MNDSFVRPSPLPFIYGIHCPYAKRSSSSYFFFFFSHRPPPFYPPPPKRRREAINLFFSQRTSGVGEEDLAEGEEGEGAVCGDHRWTLLHVLGQC